MSPLDFGVIDFNFVFCGGIVHAIGYALGRSARDCRLQSGSPFAAVASALPL